MNSMRRWISLMVFSIATLIPTTFLGQNLPTPSVLSQSDVLQRWVEALGGNKRLASAKSFHLHAKLETGGLVGTFDRWVTSNGQLREVVDLGGMYHQETVLQDAQAWILDLSGKVHELSGGDLEETVTDAYENTSSFLLQGRMKGQVQFTGEDDSHTLYVWKILPAGGKPLTIFLDKATFLPKREETQQGSSLVSTEFSNWRAQDGISFPGMIRQSNGKGEYDTLFTVENFEINPVLDSSMFSKPQETAAAAVFTGVDRSTQIHVDVFGDRLLLNVQVNGSEPGWFIFDTGAAVSVISTEWAKSLKLAANGNVEATGSGGSASSGILKDVVFGLPGVSVPAKTVAVLDLSSLLSLLGRDVVGILGYDVISRFVVRIDYQGRTITLFDPATFRYSGKGAELPLKIVGNSPQVLVKILLSGRAPIETVANIDTGASGIQLTTSFVDSHDVLSSVGSTIEKPTVGVGGGSEALQGRIAGIQVGPYVLNNPVATFMRSSQGGLSNSEFGVNLGSEILARFVSTFDYGNNKMFLEPTSHVSDPFPVDGSGLQLAYGGKDFQTLIVDGVQPGTPAETVGIRRGDIITEIDGQAADILSHDRVLRMFEEDGRSYHLKLQRGKEQLVVRLRVRSPF